MRAGSRNSDMEMKRDYTVRNRKDSAPNPCSHTVSLRQGSRSSLLLSALLCSVENIVKQCNLAAVYTVLLHSRSPHNAQHSTSYIHVYIVPDLYNDVCVVCIYNTVVSVMC